jgi:prolyl 4-hydroxylase
VSTNYAWLSHNQDPSTPTPRKYAGTPINPLGDRQSFYDSFMKGCRDKFGMIQGIICGSNDADRIYMNLRQPASMQNYTEIGYAKIKAPRELFDAILYFWERNKDKGKMEEWGVGNIYTNNWESKSDMISVDDGSLRGGGNKLKNSIWAHANKVRIPINLLFMYTSYNPISKFPMLCFNCYR